MEKRGKQGHLLSDLLLGTVLLLLVLLPQRKYHLLPEPSLGALPVPAQTSSVRPTSRGSHTPVACAPPNSGPCLAHPHTPAPSKGLSIPRAPANLFGRKAQLGQQPASTQPWAPATPVGVFKEVPPARRPSIQRQPLARGVWEPTPPSAPPSATPGCSRKCCAGHPPPLAREGTIVSEGLRRDARKGPCSHDAL